MSFEQCSTTDAIITIGLFGTCGKSNWRQKFIDSYKVNEIQWFNPNVKDWNSDCAENEARHLIEDDIVLFPILSSELGIASLAESAFSILRAVTERKSKFTIILIEDIDPSLEDRFGIDAYKGSKNARNIVKAHLQHIKHDHVYIVNNLLDMLNISELLYKACKHISTAKFIERTSNND